MGEYLQIRVSAWTYNEDDVLRAWPKLTSLVWTVQDKWAPVGARHGVVELADALPDALKFGELTDAVKSTLKEHAAKITALNKALAAALADWKPVEANRVSNELESALGEAEKALSEIEL